jgi:hypothetical protein
MLVNSTARTPWCGSRSVVGFHEKMLVSLDIRSESLKVALPERIQVIRADAWSFRSLLSSGGGDIRVRDAGICDESPGPCWG